MTAKTKIGFHGGTVSGADEGTTHERLMNQQRQPGRAEGASIHSMNASDPNEKAAGEMPQQRERDEEYPEPAEDTPPKGEGPSDGPPAMDEQHQGEGPATDDGGDSDDSQNKTRP